MAAELRAGRRRNVRLPALEELSWLIVRPVRDPTLLPLVTHLGDGEKEVLALGLETQDPLLLLDDRDARRYARALELEVSGHPRPLVASQGARRSRRGSARFGSSPCPAIWAEPQDSPGGAGTCRRDDVIPSSTRDGAFRRYHTREMILAYMNALAAGDTETLVDV